MWREGVSWDAHALVFTVKGQGQQMQPERGKVTRD